MSTVRSIFGDGPVRAWVRLRLALPGVIGGLTLLALLHAIPEPAKRRTQHGPWDGGRRSGAARGGLRSDAPRAGEFERAVLDRAHRERRSGRLAAALEAYQRVIVASEARPTHRDAARYWHARIRLEGGESSAVLDLERLVERCPDPRFVARAALAVAAACDASKDPFDAHDSAVEPICSSAEARRVIDAARRSLQTSSDVITSEGRRSNRWRERLEQHLAKIFSP